MAGELSGDRLAAGMMQGLIARGGDWVFEGVTGPAMREAGCQTIFDAEELAVMGIAEVVSHLPRLLKRRRELVNRWHTNPPDVFIGIDAPDFNLGLARRLPNTRRVHYVCPSVWAWREGRVKTLRKSTDLVLCLLPFEPEFLAQHELTGKFVGHPLARSISVEENLPAAKQRAGLANQPTLALLPGSRRSEVTKLAEDFVGAAGALLQKMPDLQIVAALANDRSADFFGEVVENYSVPVDIRVGETQAMLACADAVLVASGTATLETALNRRPMVVAYRLNALTYSLVRGFRLMRIDRYALPNILAGQAVVPEFVQSAVTPDRLASALLPLFSDSAERRNQLAEFDKLAGLLSVDANALAAEAVAELLGRNG